VCAWVWVFVYAGVGRCVRGWGWAWVGWCGGIVWRSGSTSQLCLAAHARPCAAPLPLCDGHMQARTSSRAAPPPAPCAIWCWRTWCPAAPTSQQSPRRCATRALLVGAVCSAALSAPCMQRLCGAGKGLSRHPDSPVCEHLLAADPHHAMMGMRAHHQSFKAMPSTSQPAPPAAALAMYAPLPASLYAAPDTHAHLPLPPLPRAGERQPHGGGCRPFGE